MNVKISPADVSAHEMSAWIAQLRDEGSDGGPSDAGYSDAGYSDAGYSDARPSGGTASDGAPGDGGPVRKIAAPAVSAGTPPPPRSPPRHPGLSRGCREGSPPATAELQIPAPRSEL